MKQWIIRVSVFLIVCAVFTFIAWCGGFNFDKRNGDVAFVVAYGIGFAAFLGGLAGEIL